MLRAAGTQVRTVGPVVVGLDMGAVLALGAALGADAGLLAEVLVLCEPMIVGKINDNLGA